MRFVFSSVVLLLAASSVAAQGSTAANREIRAQVAALQAAFNKQDAAGMAAVYAPDADAIVNDGPYSAGSAGLLQSGRDEIAARPKGLQIKITVVSLRFVTPDVAIANTQAHFNLAKVKDDRGTWVFVHKDGKWLVTALRVQAGQRK